MLNARRQSAMRDADDMQHTPFPLQGLIAPSAKKNRAGSNMAESSATSLFVFEKSWSRFPPTELLPGLEFNPSYKKGKADFDVYERRFLCSLELQRLSMGCCVT